jgi:hypothetical protein
MTQQKFFVAERTESIGRLFPEFPLICHYAKVVAICQYRWHADQTAEAMASNSNNPDAKYVVMDDKHSVLATFESTNPADSDPEKYDGVPADTMSA